MYTVQLIKNELNSGPASDYVLGERGIGSHSVDNVVL